MRTRALKFLIGALVLATSEGCASVRTEKIAQEGRRQAVEDLARGVIRLRTYGLPSPSYDAFARMLRAKLGVELVPVAGCLIEGDVRAEADAYNTVVKAEIVRRFGEHAVDQVAREAESEYANEVGAHAGPVIPPPAHAPD